MISPTQERSDVLKDLNAAAEVLVSSIEPRLVPRNGGNIGYAVRGARDGNGIAAISGGFTVHEGSVRCAGPAGFGADPNVSRIILTVMKFDPDIRSAGILRYSCEAFRILSEMFMESAEADPGRFPAVGSTMDWSVASVCTDGVPPVVAIRREDPETGIICIFGEEPREISSNIIILSNRII
ncbi:MAG TPA: thiamine-phosphate synthase family protein [Methanoregulaceae archaeon]|nr:thiamine-phosphate synthase family protein [Methanoregulaceae archaeon]HPD74745.1 thiamine-phosphate synthase family protein [Methanoregulaceae archaeon]HRY74692.1 thiamine-phosphate synthase family protein [Methanoregulaceae archaeon]